MKRRKVNRKNIGKNKFILISGIFLVVILIIGVVIFVIDMSNKEEKKQKLLAEEILEENQVKVVLVSDLEVEVNSKINLLSFIEKVENGEIVTEDSYVDTTKLGSHNLELVIKNNDDEEEKYSFQINVVDTEKPTIEAKEEFITYVGNSIDLLEGVKVVDNSLEDIKVDINGNYDFNTIGEYNLSYVAMDSSLNETVVDFVLKVLSDPNNYTFTTSKGYSGKVINGVTYIEGVLVVNKTYDLPSSYGSGLTSETQSAFNKMKADASSLGLNLYISSGYRSYYDQKYIYNNYVAIDGKSEADTYSARAGHSEHQTGLAFDLNTIDDSFTYTDEGKWVADNCYRYGLILRYPKGKDSITGYMHESWHLRYVGVDLASKLYNDGDWITLEEYFGIDSKYDY